VTFRTTTTSSKRATACSPTWYRLAPRSPSSAGRERSPAQGSPRRPSRRPSWLSSSTVKNRSSWPSRSNPGSGCTSRSTRSAPSSSSTARRSS
jgi:hypothetical protein